MFHNLNLHFPDVASFTAWLTTQPPCTWAPVGSTYHNTWKPNEAEWRGHASMLRMQEGYEAKGWETGPHLFLASGTAHDGIWVMTPPTMPGTHAGSCNPKRFGVEVVGDFQGRPMRAPQLTLLVETLAALHTWRNLGPDVWAHRDCMPVRTCPGDAAYAQKPEIVARLSAALTRPIPYTELSPILATPRTSSIQPIGARGDYSVFDTRLITNAYQKQATALGIDWILAIAQMLHETGRLTSWWAQRPRRNPAGIGVTGDTEPLYHPNGKPTPKPAGAWEKDEAHDLWRAGNAFATWEQHAIPAHLGRLLGYALEPRDMTEAQRRAYGYAMAVRPLPPAILGTAPVLKLLGAMHNPTGQGWADPGEFYGKSIARLANGLVGDV